MAIFPPATCARCGNAGDGLPSGLCLECARAERAAQPLTGAQVYQASGGQRLQLQFNRERRDPSEGRAIAVCFAIQSAVRADLLPYTAYTAADGLIYVLSTGRASTDVSRHVRQLTVRGVCDLVAEIAREVLAHGAGMNRVGGYLNHAIRYRAYRDEAGRQVWERLTPAEVAALEAEYVAADPTYQPWKL